MATSLNVPSSTRARMRSATRRASFSPANSNHAPSGGRAAFRAPNERSRTRMDKGYGTLQAAGRVSVRVRYTRLQIRDRAHSSGLQEAERDGGQSAQGFS